jgi:hypothetical protein
MEEWAANNSLSKVVYLTFVGVNFLVKNARGDHTPFWYFCRTPPPPHV